MMSDKDGTEEREALFRRVRQIFDDAPFVHHLGIELRAVGPGWCETRLSVNGSYLQQHGFVHAGVIATLADHTAGGAARAAVAPDSDFITVEFKINYLRPAKRSRLISKGQTLRAGKRIIVAESEVYSVEGVDEVLVAKYISTLVVIPFRARR